MRFNVLTSWLLLGLGLHVLLALAFLAMPAAPFLDGLQASCADAFYLGMPLTDQAKGHHGHLLGMAGSGKLGWAVGTLFVVLGPWRRKEAWAWHAVTWSATTWVLVDFAHATRHDVHFGAILACVMGFLLVLPALAARGDFKAAPSTPPAQS
jgi:hypothetical protein